MKKFIRISVLTSAICLMFTAMAFAATPATPANLHQTDDRYESFEVEWDSVVNAKGYEVSYSEDQKTWSEVEKYGYSTGTSKSFTGKNSGKSYYVRIRAMGNTSSNLEEREYSEWSEPIEVVTAPQQMEDKVIQTNATTSSVTISYPEVPGATQYVVTRRDATVQGTSWIAVKPSAALTQTITGLDADKKYDVKVWPQRKSSTGYVTKYEYNSRDLKNGKYAKTVSGKISGLKIDYAWANIDKMSFKWSGKENVDGYQLELYNFKTGKAEKKLIKSGYSSSSDSYELDSKTFYKVRIRSFVTMGNDVKKYSAWSGYNYVQLQQLPKLSQSGSKIKVKWSKVSGATKYTVYVAKSYSGTFKKCGTTTKTSFTIDKCGTAKLKKGNYYYVKVVAEKKVGSKTYKGTNKECQSIYLSKY